MVSLAIEGCFGEILELVLQEFKEIQHHCVYVIGPC